MYTVCDVGDKETSSKGVHGHLLEKVLGVESEARLDGSIVGTAGSFNIFPLPQLLSLEIVVLDGGKVSIPQLCNGRGHDGEINASILVDGRVWSTGP